MARLARKSRRPRLPHVRPVVSRLCLFGTADRSRPLMKAIKIGVLTPRGHAIECLHVPPRRRHISFRHLLQASNRGQTVTSHLMPTFARVDLAFERGEGAWLVATTGERYLDFTSGVAVNALGHAHPRLVEALSAQAARLLHVSNLFRIPESERLAERLCAQSFADYVVFANSGAEAMEGAIKTARKFHAVNGAPERVRIITFEGAFHGRTLA